MADLFFYTVTVLLVTGLAAWLVILTLLAGMGLRLVARACRWVWGAAWAAMARMGGLA